MDINTQKKTRLFIRANDLSEALGISISTLWRWRKAGVMPEPIALGPRIVGWRTSDIQNWLNNQ
ncbi:helix-turn-helix transcriptional regulator [Vibrio parahaemolyticus]|uniref:helix-turn-helix transcriptional regulator n=1 Tax=Vibrio parahaemolyticus TaxID=670 RepID=UPI0021530743|nr:AlpA family phage regulatory protein [Vibrio parahaemolyticus]